MSLVYDSNVFIYQLNNALGEYGQALPLVTRNLDDFQWIKGLELINPFQDVPS